MAISANNYYSNSIIGVPQAGADIDIYEASPSPKYAIGFGFQRADGNKYRYCHFGTLSPVAKICSTDHIESSMTSTQLTVGASVANTTKKSGALINPNLTGARYMQLTITATADQFRGGYMGVIAGSGTGYAYRIAGNSATGDPVLGDCYVDLWDPISQPVGPNSSFLITGCKYANLEPSLGVTQALAAPVGFTVVGQSASNYGWVCTKGITTAIMGTPVGSLGFYAIVGTNTAGTITMPSLGTGGSSTPYAIVGVITQTYSATSYCLVDASIE